MGNCQHVMLGGGVVARNSRARVSATIERIDDARHLSWWTECCVVLSVAADEGVKSNDLPILSGNTGVLSPSRLEGNEDDMTQFRTRSLDVTIKVEAVPWECPSIGAKEGNQVRSEELRTWGVCIRLPAFATLRTEGIESSSRTGEASS